MEKFKPDRHNDHLIITTTMRVKIGVDDYNSLTNCGKLNTYLKAKAEEEGVVVEDIKSIVMVAEPYCGSRREKMWNDTEEERNTPRWARGIN